MAARHVPTPELRKMVKAMAGYGIPHDDICHVVGAGCKTGKTLRRHYREELDTGEVNANAQVVGSLFKQAVGGNVAAAIFWTKARMGWSDRGPQKDEGEDMTDTAKDIHSRLEKMDDVDGIG